MNEPDRRLHIGGEIAHDDWEVLNITPAPYVDHECSAVDLSRFGDNSFLELYASHVFQYFDFDKELDRCLLDCFRVLSPGGRINVSVPNIAALARIYMERSTLTLAEQLQLIALFYGKQENINDYHKIGFTPEFLSAYLERAGFVNPTVVTAFSYFDDDSKMTFRNVPISLNMLADKPN